MDKGTTIKELLKFSHLELAELLYRANDAYNDLSKENELLKASEKAALQSQRDSFEEQQHIIDLQKGSIETLEANHKYFIAEKESKIEEQDKQIQELKAQNLKYKEHIWLLMDEDKDAEILRLQGKVKEAWEAGFNRAGSFVALDWEEWSEENNILE